MFIKPLYTIYYYFPVLQMHYYLFLEDSHCNLYVKVLWIHGAEWQAYEPADKSRLWNTKSSVQPARKWD